MARAKYCKCKNTYTINGCDNNRKCISPEYWKQGIGSITGVPIIESGFLLQENNSFLLQENNEKIIL